MDKEHLTAPEIEQAAVNAETLHLLRCTHCAQRVLGYAVARETTPFDQFPSEE